MKRPAIVTLLLGQAKSWQHIKKLYPRETPLGYETAQKFDPKLAELILAQERAMEELYKYVLSRCEDKE